MKTIIKLGLVALLMTLFSSSIYAECSKSEVMKLIDRGYSKTEISIICDIAQKTSTPTRKVNKWITPKDSTCRSKGGKLEKGICSANWQDAKAICRAMGGRLPSVSELNRVITDCEGTVDSAAENKGDPNYQSCYKRKGFAASNYYWSSTTYTGYSGHAGQVSFYYGFQSNLYTTNSFYVRCVREGQ